MLLFLLRLPSTWRYFMVQDECSPWHSICTQQIIIQSRNRELNKGMWWTSMEGKIFDFSSYDIISFHFFSITFSNSLFLFVVNIDNHFWDSNSPPLGEWRIKQEEMKAPLEWKFIRHRGRLFPTTAFILKLTCWLLEKKKNQLHVFKSTRKHKSKSFF